MKKKIKKPFDVEATKSGAVVETKSGYPVRILCYNRVGSLYPIIALVKQNGVETCYTYTIEGHQFKNDYDCRDNLVIVEEIEEPEFKVDDYIVSPEGVIFKVIEVDGTYAYKVLQLEINLITNILQDSVIGVFHKWTIADAKPGDILVSASNSPFIYKGITDADGYPGSGYPIAYCGIGVSGDFKIVDCDEYWTTDSVKPATLEQCNSLFKKMDDMGYLWDSDSLKLTKKRWRDKNGYSNGYYIATDSAIEFAAKRSVTDPEDYNVFATEKQAKSALAMARISQIMANDKRFGGVVTNEEWNYGPWSVIIRKDTTLETSIRKCYEYLAFHTEDQAKLFLKENEDLVKDYYMMD